MNAACMLCWPPMRAVYLDYLHTELRAIAGGTPRSKCRPSNCFTDPDDTGDFRVMPCCSCATASRCARPSSWSAPTCDSGLIPDQITVGKAFVLHPTENS